VFYGALCLWFAGETESRFEQNYRSACINSRMDYSNGGIYIIMYSCWNDGMNFFKVQLK